MHHEDESNFETYCCSDMWEKKTQEVTFPTKDTSDRCAGSHPSPAAPCTSAYGAKDGPDNGAHQAVSPEAAMKSQGFLWSGTSIIS